MRRKSHVRCRAGEKLEIISKGYLSLCMETVRLKKNRIELQKLDKLIYDKIPSGFDIRKTPHAYNEEIDLTIKGMKLKVEEEFTTIHNYIDVEEGILRKGAVSAKEGEKLLIPINMRDGSLICVGKENDDWNCSAPHGAGRLMSRREAKNTFTVSEFKKQMTEVYTTSVNANTLDECPMAYKGIDDIVNNIGETAEIVSRIYPIYNFKASE